MDHQLIGNGAAVIVSMLWTSCSIFFSSAGRRIGALSVNTFRITAAVGLLLTAHVILVGALLPAATDGSYLRNAGIPTYGHSGLGTDVMDNRNHGKDERILVKSFLDGHEYLYRLVKALSSDSK